MEEQKISIEQKIHERSINITKLAKIHNSIYNKLKNKHERIFQEEVIPNLDEDTKNKLLLVKKNIHEEYDKKQCINSNLIITKFQILLKSKKEYIGTEYLKDDHVYLDLRDIENEKYNFWCCGEHANFIKKKLDNLKIKNNKIIAKPDHTFNLFQINNKIFFYDLAYGELIGEFTPEFFHKHCCLLGITNMHNERGEENNNEILKSIEIFKQFQQTDHSKEMLFPRIKNYLEKIQYLPLHYLLLNYYIYGPYFINKERYQQIKFNYKELTENDYLNTAKEFKKIHLERSNIRDQNSEFQMQLTDISEFFQELYKS